MPRPCLRRAPGEGGVGAVQRPGAAVVGELGRQMRHRALGLGGDHHARGVLVEPVDDAGALDAVDARQAALAVEQQGVDQRAARRAGAGWTTIPTGLLMTISSSSS